MPRGPSSRLAALLFPAAAVAVHQLRYLLAFGGDARGELAEQGHAYLHSLTPWLVLGCAVAVGGFVDRLRRAWAGKDGGEPPPGALARLWLVISAGLLAVYMGQELLEGLLAHGHPPGLAGVFGDGGWLAMPLATAVGGVLALVLRTGRALLRLAHAAARARRSRVAPAPLAVPAGARRTRRPAMAPLATAAAGRAPPVAA